MARIYTPKDLSTAERIARVPQFVKAGAPKWVRCYDNGGETFDRYTVVFSGRTPVDMSGGEYPYVGMSAHPYHPQGFGQHGATKHQPCDRPTYGHLGKRIKFAALPPDCKKLVTEDYADYWRLDLATLRAACGVP